VSRISSEFIVEAAEDITQKEFDRQAAELVGFFDSG
jgi:hypothetical protein